MSDDAIHIINDIGHRNIRNDGVQLRNFVVTSVNGRFEAFMIDFGSCVFRRKTDDDHYWRKVKATVDEEGSVGRVVERLLGKGFRYRPSQRALKLRKEFLMVEDK